MKPISFLPFLAILLTALFTTGCEQDKCTRTEEYTAYEPVYKRIDEMRIPTTYVAAKSLTSPGKIFYYKGYLLINEMHKGIHVIDNRNPEAPEKLGFIEVPGNIDMAVNDNTLYVDSYLDLLAIDITKPTAPIEFRRRQDLLQNL